MVRFQVDGDGRRLAEAFVGLVDQQGHQRADERRSDHAAHNRDPAPRLLRLTAVRRIPLVWLAH